MFFRAEHSPDPHSTSSIMSCTVSPPSTPRYSRTKANSIPAPSSPSSSKSQRQRSASHSASRTKSQTRSHPHRRGSFHATLSTLRTYPSLYSHAEWPEDLDPVTLSSYSASHKLAQEALYGMDYRDEEKGYARASLAQRIDAAVFLGGKGLGRLDVTGGKFQQGWFGPTSKFKESPDVDADVLTGYPFPSTAWTTLDGPAYYTVIEQRARTRRRRMLIGSWMAMMVLCALGGWVMLCHQVL